MDKAELLERIDKANTFQARTDITPDQRKRAEDRKLELQEQIKILQNSDEKAVRSINAIRELLKKH
jgi:hypothetical protein